MAVDTRDKRASAIGVGSAVPRFTLNPNGTIGPAAREGLGHLYVGIAANIPSIAMEYTFWLVVEALPG